MARAELASGSIYFFTGKVNDRGDAMWLTPIRVLVHRRALLPRPGREKSRRFAAGWHHPADRQAGQPVSLLEDVRNPLEVLRILMGNV